MTSDPSPAELTIDLETAAFIAKADRRWRDFLVYWRGLVARVGHWPARVDLDPIEMGANLLGNIFLIDIERSDSDEQQRRYRFRLIGDEITQREVVRPGMYLDELGTISDLAGIEGHYEEAISGFIRLRRSSLRWESRGKD